MNFIFFVLFAAALAAQQTYECGTTLTCTYDDQTFEFKITGSGAMTNFDDDYFDFTDPNAVPLENRTLCPWKSLTGNFQTLTISPGVTHIGNRAFKGIGSLTQLEIPDSVETIGEYAFASGFNIQTLTIGDSSKLTSIGQYSFQGFAAGKSSNNIELILPQSLKEIGYSAFGSTGVKKVRMNGVKKIAS